jgi:predicted nucleic acid-binding protein
MSSTAAPEVLLCDTSFVGARRAATKHSWISADWPSETTERIAGATLAISVITVAEERAGEIQADWGPGNVATADAARRAFVWVPIDAGILERWASLVAQSAKSGMDCKPHQNDVWIAATAIERDLPLVTCDGWQARLPGLPEVIHLNVGARPSSSS